MRPLRLESRALAPSRTHVRPLAREETIASTVAQSPRRVSNERRRRPAGGPRTMASDAPRGQDPDPALDPARRAAARPAFLWVVAGAVKHVLFLFIVALLIALFFDPIIRRFHVAEFPAASRSRSSTSWPCWSSSRARSRWASCVTQSKRAATRFDDYFTKVQPSTHRDPRRPGRRPAPVLAEHPQPERDPCPEAGPRPGQEHPEEGRRQVHAQDRHVPRRRGDLGRTARLRPRPDRGDLHLHAARDAEVSARRSTGASRRTTGLEPLIERMSRAVVGYVKGQLLVSLIIGTSVGVGMWVLGRDRPRAGRGPLRAPVRRVGRRSPS